MKYHTLFFRKLGKILKNLLSAVVVIGALRIMLLFTSQYDIIRHLSVLCFAVKINLLLVELTKYNYRHRMC